MVKLELLEYFEERGANFDFQNGNGCALLHCVAKETAVKYVAEQCLNVDAIDNNGELPVCSTEQNLDIVKYVRETKNANVYLCNKNCEISSSEPGSPENEVCILQPIISWNQENTVIKHSDVMK
jgi:hypothetical protein